MYLLVFILYVFERIVFAPTFCPSFTVYFIGVNFTVIVQSVSDGKEDDFISIPSESKYVET